VANFRRDIYFNPEPLNDFLFFRPLGQEFSAYISKFAILE